MFEKYFRMDDFIDIIEVISCIRLFIAALWGNVIWKQGCFSVAFYDLKILPFKFVTAVSSLTLKCQCHPTRGPLTNQFFVTFLSTTTELSAISWNMSLGWYLPLMICYGIIQILCKQVVGHFLTQSPTHYVSMIYVLNVSKNGHFSEPTHPVLCLHNIWMVPM